MFEKILIANRGEIACRVIRTCRALGIRTIAVYSEADVGAQHVRLADEAYCIGGPGPQDSYLRGDVILEVALKSGAQAIHPGYGFLSENADFAEAVEAAGITFIGPPAASMRRMGSKAGAKELMQAAGVPVVPGYTGEEQSPDMLHREADRIGYPLMIKAAHGGGGKGMRIVRASGEFPALLESCQREARNAFGRDRVLLERYVEQPRHIEIQVFADRHGNTLHLFERECSAQRRYQKVLEESPSTFLSADMRRAMGDAAVQAARAIDYVNAGTVEFIVAPDGGFYFMEINTRLQVEHPVTEMVAGHDLVEWQLRVAAGEALPCAQEDLAQRGHAIEVRLYAEDPDAGFLPGSGRLQRLRLPNAAPGVRIDSGVVEGDEVTIFYDPMLAKLIVHGADRSQALARMRAALAACEIIGPKSNIGFLERLVRHPAVVDGTIDTGYLDRHLDEFLAPGADDHRLFVCAVVARLLAREADTHRCNVATNDMASPWALVDGWRVGTAAAGRLAFHAPPGRVEVRAAGHAGDYLIEHAGHIHEIRGALLDDTALSLQLDGSALRVSVLRGLHRWTVHDGTSRLSLEAAPLYEPAVRALEGGTDRIATPMPGRVVLVRAAPGDSVEAGQEVMVIEAMKMELSLKAPRAGIVAEIRAGTGEFVEADTVLVTLEPST